MELSQHGRIWAEEEIDTLIKIYSEEEVQSKVKNHLRKHGAVWQLISERMATMNFPRSPAQVKDKLNNLRRRYLELKRSLRSGDSPPEWSHWGALHQLYSSSPAGTPEALVDSLVSSEVAACEEGTGIPKMTSGTSATPSRKRRRRPDPMEALWAARNDIKLALARMEEREERALACLEKTAEAVWRGPSTSSSCMPHPRPPVSMPQSSPPVSMPQSSPPISMPQSSPPISMPHSSPPVSMHHSSPPISMPHSSPPVSLRPSPQPSTSQPSPKPSPKNLLSHKSSLLQVNSPHTTLLVKLPGGGYKTFKVNKRLE